MVSRGAPFNFIVGKPGSGKTLLAVQIALDQFFKKQCNKIIITRPTVSTEDNGFLPGSEKEKMEPWLVPIRSNMRKIYNKPLILEKMEIDEKIELVSLAHFRGRTFEIKTRLLDEASPAGVYYDETSATQDASATYRTITFTNRTTSDGSAAWTNSELNNLRLYVEAEANSRGTLSCTYCYIIVTYTVPVVVDNAIFFGTNF